MDRIIDRIQNTIGERIDVFGSSAYGFCSSSSDLDLMIVCQPLPAESFAAFVYDSDISEKLEVLQCAYGKLTVCDWVAQCSLKSRNIKVPIIKLTDKTTGNLCLTSLAITRCHCP
jgi:DNA polymerase sigma